MAIKWTGWPHVLRLQQHSAATLEAIVEHALRFEEALVNDRKWPRLSQEKRVAADNSEHQRRIRTLFYQPSTRTEATFLDACEGLGCSVHAVKDPRSFSSAQKGESDELAIMAYTTAGGLGSLRSCDGLVIRTEEKNMPQRAVDTIETALHSASSNPRPIFVINAGDGSEGQHPTQAFVDLATIARHRKTPDKHFLDGLTVLFPGDVARSRVINSLLYAFGRFENNAKINVIFCCPEGLDPQQEILTYLARHRVEYEFVRSQDFDKAVRRANVIYMTRLQREYDSKGGKAIALFSREDYVLRKEHMDLLREDAIVMHPLPINQDPTDPPAEIDPALIPLAIAGHPKLVFAQQSLRGLPTRAALLDLIFQGFDERGNQIASF